MTSTARADAYAFFDHPGPLPFAHRGGATYGPNRGIENSMRAFEHAIGLGYRYLETDVQATADGVLMAFHDSTLDRVTDRSGRIAELPYAEVAKARIGGTEPIPRLEEVLSAWPTARFNIDVKSAAAVHPFATVIEQYDAYDRVCAASFSGPRLRAIRRMLPRIATSLTPSEAARLRFPPRLLARAVAPQAPCVQVPVGYRGLSIVTSRFVDTVHQLGGQVHVWTIDDPTEIRRLLDLGVDGIISDRIDILRDVLLDREQWVTGT